MIGGIVTDTIYLVVRCTRRGGTRVLCITGDKEHADKVYSVASTDLRDGDLSLVEFPASATKKLRVVSGGYNRTRW
jgi:hypothetical protein